MEDSVPLRERMFALIEQWEQSGMSRKAFFTQHQIAYHRFYYWYKLYCPAHQDIAKQRSTTFVPLNVESAHAHTELVLPGGVRIIFHQLSPLYFFSN